VVAPTDTISLARVSSSCFPFAVGLLADALALLSS
jgi:hypothetical protein